MKDLSRLELENQMRENSCNHKYFERLSNLKPSISYNQFERLQNYMFATKAIVSTATGLAGYFFGNYFSQQTFDDNITPKIIGGLAALTAMKLIGKPAARAGLDLGLRTNQR